jgi:hypothetical protein
VLARLGTWARLTALGGVWGVVMALWLGVSPVRGLVVGLALWGASLFVAVQGPYAPVFETSES